MKYRSPEMLIFQDDIHIDKYGEDVFAFKTDAEKCFKYLLKIHRGKRKECADMSALFHEMLEQDFPELFVTPPPSSSSSIIVTHDTSQESGRKRSRSSVSSSGITHDEAVLKSEVRSEKKVSRVSDSSSSSIVKKEEATVHTTLPSKMKVQ